MSGFVRRAQRKIANLEAQLAYAHRRLAREIELDVERAAVKAKKAAVKAAAAAERKAKRAAEKAARDATKGDRAAERRAARQANPRRVRLETFHVLMTLCLKDNLACTMDTVDAYMEWKKTVEFPPKTNLYQKCTRFLKETVRDETVAVPVYAKTMTGELIPLVYHHQHDTRYLLLQLERINPEEFPIGSTILRHISDDPSSPVQEGDLFGLFRHNATRVYYESDREEFAEFYPSEDRVVVEYSLMVRANGFDNYREETDETEEETDETEDEEDVSKYRERCQQRILLYYSPEQQTIITGMNRIYFPLSEMRTMLRELQFYDNMYCTHYRLTEQAQEEMIAIFEAVRRDR